jgi:hypothetical protein
MGQFGSAMTNPNTSAPDPSGFNGSEWAARFAGGAGKGLLQGAANQSQMQRPQAGGSGFQVPMAQQPQVNLPQGNFGPATGDPGSGPPQKAKNPFFYGYGQ